MWLSTAPAGAQSPRPGGTASRHAQGTSCPAPAQVLTGTVRTEADDLLPGATVLLKGTFFGSSTDGAGQFVLSLPPNSARAAARSACPMSASKR